MYKQLRLIFTFIMSLAILTLLISGCGKQGSRYGNNPPTIAITSFEGYSADNPYSDSTAITSFQQKIYWHATDTDGIVTGYAYRILDSLGVPISTARNDFIDTDGSVTPSNVLEKFGAGWVLHYKSGADQSIPLNNPEAKRTIWTKQKYATINFIAADSLGNPLVTVSQFEVICIDNRGAICEHLAYRKFKSTSAKPSCYLSTTRGDPAGAQVGTGIKLDFKLEDYDPYLQAAAWYYEFQVCKCDKNTNQPIQPIDPRWYSTKNLPDISKYKLTKHTTPNLSSDYDAAGNQLTYTRVIARVYDLAGVKSDCDTIKFIVKEGFHPKTLIYLQRTYAVGSNHFVESPDETTPEIWPYTVVGNKNLYATHFFKDIAGDYTVVQSENLKVWIRWGWHGEYAKVSTVGSSTNYDFSEDNPYNKKVDMLLDEDTNQNYYSEITHFDLRLDGAPYNYPPLADSIITDPNTGLRWLRVPVHSSLGQTVVLSNLSANTAANPYHTFEVRAVDLQDEPDPTPAVFNFKVVPAVPQASKSGVLIIDDDTNHPQYSPAAIVDSLWMSYFNGTGITPSVIHYTDLSTYDNRKLALSDIEAYKLVIFHSERLDQASNLDCENDCINIYLKQGGNLLVTLTGKSKQTVDNYFIKGYSTLNQYFGIPYRNSPAITGSITSLNQPYFIGANGQTAGGINFNSIPLRLPGFNNLVNARQGLYSVTYFTFAEAENPNLKFIYTFNCKQPNTDSYSPSQSDYNQLNNKPVGIRKVNPKVAHTVDNWTKDSKCYMLGFPLSYMDTEQVKAFIAKVLADVM
ncbi:MAG TPA: hypothetical protein PLF50_05085 [Candidatus Cloacimonadota bacterium]|nr:hypothetical protein [Candidatus Cloacimonadota bacterium]